MLNQRFHWSLSKKKKTTHPLTCCSSSSNSLEEVPNSRMGCVQGWFPWADTIASQVSSGSPTSSAIVRVRYRWNRRRSPCNPSTRSSRSYRRKIMADRWSNNHHIWIILRSCRSRTCRNRSLSLWGWRPRCSPRARRTPGSRCTPGTECSSSQRSSSFWSVCLGTAGTLSRTDL